MCQRERKNMRVREKAEEKNGLRGEKYHHFKFQQHPVCSMSSWWWMLLPFIPKFLFISSLGVVGRDVPKAGQIMGHSCDGTGALGVMLAVMPLQFWVAVASLLFAKA